MKRSKVVYRMEQGKDWHQDVLIEFAEKHLGQVTIKDNHSKIGTEISFNQLDEIMKLVNEERKHWLKEEN